MPERSQAHEGSAGRDVELAEEASIMSGVRLPVLHSRGEDFAIMFPSGISFWPLTHLTVLGYQGRTYLGYKKLPDILAHREEVALQAT